jgi:hypothetical protein
MELQDIRKDGQVPRSPVADSNVEMSHANLKDRNRVLRNEHSRPWHISPAASSRATLYLRPGLHEELGSHGDGDAGKFNNGGPQTLTWAILPVLGGALTHALSVAELAAIQAETEG